MSYTKNQLSTFLKIVHLAIPGNHYITEKDYFVSITNYLLLLQFIFYLVEKYLSVGNSVIPILAILKL